MVPTDPTGCPAVEALAGLITGGLDPRRERELTGHLDLCDRCRARLDAVAAGGDLANGFRQAAQQPVARSQPLDTAIDLLKATPPAGLAAAPGDGQPYAELLPWLEPSPRGIGRVGDYQLTRFLGRGGMGLVFAGRDETLDRPVAVKFLSPALAAEATCRERFTREARATAAVNHPNVVTILAIAETQGLPYIVMERVDGGSLDRHPARDTSRGDPPLSCDRVAMIGHQVAAGLQAAHTAGLLHRDVKPGNILVSADGKTVKLTDFGLARPLAEVTEDTVAGTPGYVSPELLTGEKPSPASDLFGLGCVLFELIAGHPPLGSGGRGRPDAVAAAPLRDVAPATLPWLAAIVDRLLATDPAIRFQSAADVAAALADGTKTAAGGLPVANRPADTVRLNPISRQRRTLAAAIVAVTAAASLIVFSLLSGPAGLDAAGLAAALDTAASGEQIVITGGGRFDLPGLNLGDRNLAVRGEDPRPVLRLVTSSDDPEQSLFRTNGDLVLTGLALELVVGPDAPANVARSLIEIDGGSLRLEDCTLVVVGEGDCVIARDAAELEVIDSSLHAPQGTVIDWTPAAGGEATAERTIVSGRTGWAVADPVDALLQFDRVTGVVDRLVSLRWEDLESPADGHLTIAMTATAVAAEEALLLLHTESISRPEFEAAVSFRGWRNLIEGSPVLLDRETGLRPLDWLAEDAAAEPANLTSEESVFREIPFGGDRRLLREWPESAAGEAADVFALDPDDELRDEFGDDPPGALERW